MAQPPARRRKRAPLSAERIAEEAMALIDDAGLDGLSFRALGKRLGCEAMSLYHYYPSKAHLIDALVNQCLAETPIPGPGASYRERMREFCLRYRATVLRHPAFAQVFVTHRLNHREGLAWLEQLVGMMAGSGLPPERSAVHFRVLSYYVSGATIDEALGYAAGPSAAEPVPADEAQRDFPGIMKMGSFFGTEHHLEFFETGLDLILDWHEAEIARHNAG